jgi:hypothetical protein
VYSLRKNFVFMHNQPISRSSIHSFGPSPEYNLAKIKFDYSIQPDKTVSILSCRKSNPDLLPVRPVWYPTTEVWSDRDSRRTLSSRQESGTILVLHKWVNFCPVYSDIILMSDEQREEKPKTKISRWFFFFFKLFKTVLNTYYFDTEWNQG